MEEVKPKKVRKKRTKKVEGPKTFEFTQDGVQYRKTYNANGDVIKTEQL